MICRVGVEMVKVPQIIHPLTLMSKILILSLPPANEVCEGYVFTGVCLSTGGACVVARGHAWLGGHAWFRGACMVAGVCVWLWGASMVGACMVTGGCMVVGAMHGCGGCMVAGGCIVAGGVHGCGGLRRI